MYEEYEDYDLEPNRHKKIKKTTTPKTKKSKHKHEYVDCVFDIPFDYLGRSRTTYSSGKYCSICGKITINKMLQDYNGKSIHLNSYLDKSIDLKEVS